MPSESLYFNEHDLYVAHLFIITRRNTAFWLPLSEAVITSHIPFGTVLFVALLLDSFGLQKCVWANFLFVE